MPGSGLVCADDGRSSTPPPAPARTAFYQYEPGPGIRGPRPPPANHARTRAVIPFMDGTQLLRPHRRR